MSKKFLQIIVFAGMSGFSLEAANAELLCLEGETMYGKPVFDTIEIAAMKACKNTVCVDKNGTCRSMKFIQHTDNRGDIKGWKVACCLPEKK